MGLAPPPDEPAPDFSVSTLGLVVRIVIAFLLKQYKNTYYINQSQRNYHFYVFSQIRPSGILKKPIKVLKKTFCKENFITLLYIENLARKKSNYKLCFEALNFQSKHFQRGIIFQAERGSRVVPLVSPRINVCSQRYFFRTDSSSPEYKHFVLQRLDGCIRRPVVLRKVVQSLG